MTMPEYATCCAATWRRKSFTGNQIDCNQYSNWELKNNLKWYGQSYSNITSPAVRPNGGTSPTTGTSMGVSPTAQSIIPVVTQGIGVSTSIPYPCYSKYLQATTQNATLTISKGGTNDGVYYPSIYLKDLSGNQTLITNNQQTQDYLTSLLKEIRPDSNRSYVGGICVITAQTLGVANPTCTPATTPNQTTVNGITLGTKKIIDSDKIRNLNIVRFEIQAFKSF